MPATTSSLNPAHADLDFKVLSDYFNLEVDLAQLAQHWASRDPHYAFVNQHLFGCRMLRQDPVECLFQFICSSNNHISRIHGMVNYLCRAYGTELEISAGVMSLLRMTVCEPIHARSVFILCC